MGLRVQGFFAGRTGLESPKWPHSAKPLFFAAPSKRSQQTRCAIHWHRGETKQTNKGPLISVDLDLSEQVY